MISALKHWYEYGNCNFTNRNFRRQGPGCVTVAIACLFSLLNLCCNYIYVTGSSLDFLNLDFHSSNNYTDEKK